MVARRAGSRARPGDRHRKLHGKVLVTPSTAEQQSFQQQRFITGSTEKVPNTKKGQMIKGVEMLVILTCYMCTHALNYHSTPIKYVQLLGAV